MGAGKTYWSKKWAEAYGLTLYDMDQILEAEEGMSCVEIFENKGEQYFREKESRLLRQLTRMGGDNIISCGGGTPIYKDNMDFMMEHGTTIYLNASPSYLLKNLTSGNNKEKRSLIKNIDEKELLFHINKKLLERIPVYKRSMFVLDVDKIKLEDFENCMTHA
jgi:shikimate kinase